MSSVYPRIEMQAMANAGRIIDLLNSKKDMHKQTNVQTSGMIARGKETGRNTNNTNKNHNALSTRMNSIAFNPIRTNFRCFADMVFPLETSRSYIRWFSLLSVPDLRKKPRLARGGLSASSRRSVLPRPTRCPATTRLELHKGDQTK